jgi:hypothetical protein
MIINRGLPTDQKVPNFKKEREQNALDWKIEQDRKAREDANIVRIAMCEAYR